jgi:hypothetical protein
VLGNGPSLDRVGTKHLAGAITIGCNHAWRGFERWDRETDFLLLTDRLRLQELTAAQPQLRSTQLVLGDHRSAYPSARRYAHWRRHGAWALRQLLRPNVQNKPWLHPFLGWHETLVRLGTERRQLSFDYARGYCFGESVVIAGIQLAVTLGAKEVWLCGVDASTASGSYFAGMPAGVQQDQAFLQNPRKTLEPFLALCRAYLDEQGIRLLDASDGNVRSLEQGRLDDLVTP